MNRSSIWGRAVCSVALLAAAGLTTTGSALAQPAAASEAEVSPAPTPPPAPQDEVAITEEARELFRSGVALLEDPDGARLDGAYRAFKAAYANSPSPKILYNLGLTAMRLERDAEAIKFFTLHLDKMPLSPEARAGTERDLATLKSNIATVKLKVTPSGVAILDERLAADGGVLVNRYGPFEGEDIELSVRAGIHKLKIRLKGHEDQEISVELSPKQQVAHTIELEATGSKPDVAGPSETERPIPTSVWVMLGVTGAFGIGTGVTGVLALSESSAFTDVNTGADPTAAQTAHDDAQTLNIVTDALLGATVVSAVVTGALYFTRPEVAAGDSASLHILPTVGPSAAGLTALGSF